MLLSKSTFLLGLTCPRKVAYALSGYPTSIGGDFAELLAEGGERIGEVARMRYPGGRLIAERRNLEAERVTAELLGADSVTLFEPAVRSGVLFARHDILVKDGNRLDLIEVKSVSLNRLDTGAYPMVTRAGGVRGKWKTIISDIAFQRLVLSRAFPDAEIRCFLLCPDANAVATRDGLPGTLRERAGGGVEFVGSADEASALADLLTLEPVDDAVALLSPEIASVADRLAALYVENGSVAKAPVQIGYHCKSCEFRTDGLEPDGFRECWGALADPEPHLFDLYQLYSLGNGQVANAQIAAGCTALADVPEELIIGPYAERQRIQLRHQLAGTEWVSDALGGLLAGLPRPLQFIDFETCTPVLPEYAGMHPNETIAFQWSCHTVAADGATLTHREWLHDPAISPGCPNLEFARSLLAALNSDGTVLTWTTHEAGVLRGIARTIRERQPEHWALADELDALANRLVDQCEMCRQHYFHPRMRGSNSLKAVLPGIWESSEGLRSHPWFAACNREEAGVVLDPYKCLPPMQVDGAEETVCEGTGAIRAYHELLHGPVENRPIWRDLLLQYCRLDTLAMVIIWKHWAACGSSAGGSETERPSSRFLQNL